MNRDLKTVLTWARSVTADGLGAPPRVVEAIDRLTAKPRARKRLDLPGKTKAQRKAERDAETAEIRDYVDRRDPYCVICLEPAPEPWEMHHADSGSGKSQRQTKRNCFKTHEGCHKRAHRGEFPALIALRRYADALGYSETVAVLQRRIDKKCEGIRAQHPERKAG